MKKDAQDLRTTSWTKIMQEMVTKFPFLLYMIFSVMLPPEHRSMYTKVQKVIPKICLIYGIMMQCRNAELSRVQRIISMLLMDNICDQKVFNTQ